MRRDQREHTENSLLGPVLNDQILYLAFRIWVLVLTFPLLTLLGMWLISTQCVKFFVSGIPENKYKLEGCGWIIDFLELAVYSQLQDKIFF